MNCKLWQKCQTLCQRCIIIVLAVLVLGIFVSPPAAASSASGERLFNYYCAGCHAKGGNIVRRGKTLKMRSLEQNKMDTLEAIAQLVNQGKNNMPGFRDRLTPEQIETVSHYVLQQAQNNWQS